ncbi:MAG TPA: phospholipase D-like domain-containing protein [Kiritimatiellia bacterium]|jgi:phosphatidylserine/phosphatidylglycerophosphate/cardiolipin synthase-like enzyme|nr:MAG: Phospholipase D precursor [Verrucomicrobia bacterium ADurb.Bin018]HOE36231.1 phospholipase D-like domain-containing protein [Kiritimatiellia bacterium]HOR73668.1 phospholipase D-like domain-containing protein [Kiritimatiellia bacterium]HOU59424.1 phospholipase D-like domain-containing protein [Kiritimatiellia bacterium]HPK68550.1 phospholipase D-like domain-containing protein [Kiritimatiellia bacterium]
MTKPTGKIWLLLTLLALAAPLGRAELVREELPDASDWVHDIVFEHEAGADDGTLSVRLGTDPVTVRYFEVPLSVWAEFKAAESKGSFYGLNIRQRYERQYGKSRQEVFDSPLPIQTQINALCAFNEECEDVVLEGIEKSRESIWVAAYAFTRTRIAAALIRAHQRGVRVAVKMDVNQAEFAGAQKLIEWLRREGIPVTLIRTAGDYSAMHNKFMIFDMRWVVTGSYNFTTTAQVSNWENLVWVDSPDMAEQYKQAWDAIVSDEVVEPRAEKTAAPKNPRPPKRRNIDGGAGAGLVFREDWRHADPGTEPA